jgi:hypothetical protein
LEIPVEAVPIIQDYPSVVAAEVRVLLVRTEPPRALRTAVSESNGMGIGMLVVEEEGTIH